MERLDGANDDEPYSGEEACCEEAEAGVLDEDERENGWHRSRDEEQAGEDGGRNGVSALGVDDAELECGVHVEHRVVVCIDDVDDLVEVVAFKSDAREHVLELILLVLAVMLEMLAFEGELRFEDLLLGFRGDVLADRHRYRSGDRSGYAGQENVGGIEATTNDTRNEEERGDQTVVDAEDDVSHVLACCTDVRHVAVGQAVDRFTFGHGGESRFLSGSSCCGVDEAARRRVLSYRGGMEDTTGPLSKPQDVPDELAKVQDLERAAESYPESPPWSDNAKLLVIAMAFVLAVIGIYLIRNVIAVAALAGLIAFLIAPLVRLGVTRLKLPRWVALLAAYLLVFFGTLAFGGLLARSIVQSIVELDPVGLVNEVRIWLLDQVNTQGHLVVAGITVDMNSVLDSLKTSVGTGDGEGGFIVDAERFLEYLGAGLSGFRTVLGFLTAVVTSAIVTTLIAMYLNVDSMRMRTATIANIPPGYERDGLMMLSKIKSVWRGYLYGQLVNSLITGTLVFLVLWAVGLPGAFLMGAIMVVLNMIPTFGPILAAIPGVLAALLSGSTRWPELENYWFALIVVGIYLVVVQAQANIVAPKVMGTAVQLRPAIVLLGLMVGFQVGGLLGSLLAVPVIASIRDVMVYVWRKTIDQDPWPDDDPIVVESRS